MAELSQQHGREMHRHQDAPHLKAMQKMQELMKDPEQMQQWFEPKKTDFEGLSED